MNTSPVLPALLLLLTLFVATTFSLLGMYKWDWDNGWTRLLAKTLPLPAGVVNGRLITLAELGERIALYQRVPLSETGNSASGGADSPGVGERRKAAFQSLVDEKVVLDLAEKEGIVVGDLELDRYFKFLLNRLGISPEAMPNEIQRTFGLDDRGVRRQIVYPDLLKARLFISWLQTDVGSAAYQKATRVLQQLRAGLKFEEAAKIYSEDEASKFLGGDLGFMRQEDLPPWLADGVFALKIGEVSEIVSSVDGYHIFEVVAKDEESDPGRLEVRHILIRASGFADYFEVQKQNYRVYQVVKL